MKIRGFDDCFDLLMGSEKGFTINAADPGNWTSGTVGQGSLEGTNWGITCRVAREAGYKGDMRDLSKEAAKQIAYDKYWKPIMGDQLPPELAYDVLDTYYNGGHAIKWLQEAVGAKADGIMGAATISAANRCDIKSAIMLFNADRLDYLASLPYALKSKFDQGWERRIANILREGAD